MTQSMLIDNIGLLVTNDPESGHGPLGIVRDACVVIEGNSIRYAGERAAAAADMRMDAAGNCVMPGFVDSHTHLVFAGDRSDEFVARMAGAPYAAGGIRTTVDATRAASDSELRAGMMLRWRQAMHGGTTTIEIKSGYGLNSRDEVRSLRIARELSEETTFIGAHVVPVEFEGRSDDYVDLVCGEMLAEAREYSRWIDAFCERGAFDAAQCRRILNAGRNAGLGLRLHGNQLGHGPGVQLAVEMGCASVDHCTYLSDADVNALAASRTVATLLPATDFSTRQPYPDARRLLDAGVRLAIATNCNPGSSYTTSMPFCITLAVREMHMTIEEAVSAATTGGASALQRSDIGRIAQGFRADIVLLDAPSYTYLVYRPGTPLVRAVIKDGEMIWDRDRLTH